MRYVVPRLADVQEGTVLQQHSDALVVVRLIGEGVMVVERVAETVLTVPEDAEESAPVLAQVRPIRSRSGRSDSMLRLARRR